MIDESRFGTRNRRGHWEPSELITYPPVFVWPVQVGSFLKWLPSYFLPFNVFFAALSVVLWLYFIPSSETVKVFSPGWISRLLLLNAAIIFLYYGALHLRLYVLQRQGTQFKYNPRWPATGNRSFMFGSQTIDNMIWTFGSALPIVTIYESMMLWAVANGHAPAIGFRDHLVYSIIVLILIPVFHEVYFYLIHRLIHWPPLYRTIHHIHHKNFNPGPWSGLAMHTAEHILYFGGVFVFLLVPADPLHLIFYVVYLMLAPAGGHSGFDKVVVGEEGALDTHSYAHYLHHKYFECNYTDGIIPIDKWAGTFHDGSPEAQKRMEERLRERARKRSESEARP